MRVSTPKSHIFLQYNFKKNTLWKIKSISRHSNESVEPLVPLRQFSILLALLAPFNPKVNLLFYSSACQMMGTNSSTPGRVKDMRPLYFLSEI